MRVTLAIWSVFLLVTVATDKAKAVALSNSHQLHNEQSGSLEISESTTVFDRVFQRARKDEVVDEHWDTEILELDCVCSTGSIFLQGVGGAIGGIIFAPSKVGISVGVGAGAVVGEGIHEGMHNAYDHREEIIDTATEAWERHHEVTGDSLFSGSSKY